MVLCAYLPSIWSFQVGNEIHLIWSKNSKIKILKIDNFSGTLEMMIINLDYIFATFVCRVKNSFCIYLLWCNRWINSSSFKQKIQKWIDSFWLKIRWFPTKLLMTILKSRCHSKIIQFFSCYLNELFTWSFPCC